MTLSWIWYYLSYKMLLKICFSEWKIFFTNSYIKKSQLFIQQIVQAAKTLATKLFITGPLFWKSTNGFLTQWVSKMEGVSISWRHHVPATWSDPCQGRFWELALDDINLANYRRDYLIRAFRHVQWRQRSDLSFKLSTLSDFQYILWNMRTVLLCFDLLWLYHHYFWI